MSDESVVLAFADISTTTQHVLTKGWAIVLVIYIRYHDTSRDINNITCSCTGQFDN